MRDLTAEEIEEAIFARKDSESAKTFLYSLMVEDGQEQVDKLLDSTAYADHWRHSTVATVKHLVNRMFSANQKRKGE